MPADIRALARIPITDDGYPDWAGADSADAKLAIDLIKRDLAFGEGVAKQAARERGGAVPYAERKGVVGWEDDPADREGEQHPKQPGRDDLHSDNIRSSVPTWMCQAARKHNEYRGSWRTFLKGFIISRVCDYLRGRKIAGTDDHGNRPTYDATNEIISELGLDYVFEKADVEVQASGSEIIKAHWFKGKSCTRIARDRGVSVAAISKVIARFRTKLPYFGAAIEIKQIAKKVNNNKQLSQPKLTFLEGVRIDTRKGEQQQTACASQLATRPIYAQRWAAVNGDLQKICGKVRSINDLQTMCWLEPGHEGTCAQWFDRPRHVSPHYVPVPAWFKGIPDLHHLRLGPRHGPDTRWFIEQPAVLTTVNVVDPEHRHRQRKLPINLGPQQELYQVQDDDLGEVIAAHVAPWPDIHIPPELLPHTKQWRPERKYQIPGRVRFRGPYVWGLQERQIAADPWMKEFPLDGWPDSRLLLEEILVVPWSVPGWSLDEFATHKPEPPKPFTDKRRYETWSIQDTSEFKCDEYNRQICEGRAHFYAPAVGVPTKQRKASGKVVVVQRPFPPGTAACAAPQVFRQPLPARREWRRRNHPPAPGNVIGLFDWLDAQPMVAARKVHSFVCERLHRIVRPKEEQHGAFRTGLATWFLTNEEMHGQPLRDGADHGLKHERSDLFKIPGEKGDAEQRLVNKPSWEWWLATNEAVLLKYKQVQDAPAICCDRQTTFSMETTRS